MRRTAALFLCAAWALLLLGGCDGDGEGGGTSEAPVEQKGPTQSSPIAVSSDGRSVWVVNPDSDTVARIDAATNTLAVEISVDDNPRTLALRGLRHVFVANQDSDTLSRLEFDGDRVRTLELPFGSAPYGVAVRPQGDLVVVTLERTDEVALVEPDSLRVVARIPVARTPRGIAIDAAGRYAYVSHFVTFEPSHSSRISVIDLDARALARTYELPPDFVTCETDASGPGITNLCSTVVLPPEGAPDGLAGTLWVGCQRSNNVAKGLFLRSPTMGGRPFPADNFVGRSRNIFKASFHDIIRSIMARVNLETGEVDYIDVDDGGLVSGIGFSPDGTTAYLVDERFNLFGVFNPLRRDPAGERPTITILGSDSTQPPGQCNGVFNDARDETAFDHYLPPSVELEPGDMPVDESGSPVATGWDPFLGRAIPDGVGTTPIGLAVSPDGQRVYVANFLSRNVTVVLGDRFACLGEPERSCDEDRDCPSGKCQVVIEAVVPTTTRDPLPPEILDGKILFNTAARDGSVANDFGLRRPVPPENLDLLDVLEPPGAVVNVSHDATYVACASCHPEAGFDGRTWDFSQFGTSLRNTMSLIGRSSFAPGTCANGAGECVTDADCGSGVPLGTCLADPRFVPDNNPAVAAHRERFFNPMGTIHWNGDRDEVEDFEHTFRSLMGAGDCEGVEDIPAKCYGALILRTSTAEPVDVNPELGEPNRGLGPRLNHLADYVYSVRRFVRNPNLRPDGKPRDEAAERGRVLFNDPEVGCASCHNGPSHENQLFTDKGRKNPLFDPAQPADARNNPFLRHDVGTANVYDETDPLAVAVADDVFHNRPNPNDPNDLVLPPSRAPLRAYLTPTLVDVWHTAPYLHDGSARTLLDVVCPCDSSREECCNPVEEDCTGKNTCRNVDDRHGKTSHLSEEQLADLVAFLRAPHGPVADLPPAPPAETLPAVEPPELPGPSACPVPDEVPTRVGEPFTLQVRRMVLDLLSVGFTIPVFADGVVATGFLDEDAGIIQLDGASFPKLEFRTPAGNGTIDFDDRLFEGSFDHETGAIHLRDVGFTLVFLPGDPSQVELCYLFDLRTGTSTVELEDGSVFTVTGRPLDEETGDVLLTEVFVGPPSPLSPPLATAFVLEGTVIVEGHP
ncbi:MAG: hypothetical protein KatS3mg076_2605 [Candidatus Binatia bacterium]|nr:MAG: hypothetical protein KatS3mg076_2605 [Candidatus Binatia bacterium]